MPKITWLNLDELLIPAVILATGLQAPADVRAERATPAKAVGGISSLQSDSKEWLELYAFVSPHEMTGLQQAGCVKYIQQKLHGQTAKPYQAIAEIWPSIKRTVDRDQDQKKNFQGLLRALLRAQLRSAKFEHEREVDKGYLDDINFISQLLGPLRVAVPGNPSLTEDAVDAYADMACFLYEKNNPGKSVDALENRLLFTRVISSKFEDAPDESAKKAMANFDLTWSKFKICWGKADETTRQQLVKIWSNKNDTKYSIKSNNAEMDSLLEKIISSGPWNMKH